MNLLQTLLATTATAAIGVAAITPMRADAALILTLDDLSTAGVDVTLVDGAIGDLLGPGAVLYAGPVGNWTLSSTTGLGNGWSTIFGIDLNSLSVSSALGGTLRISLTETDLALGFPDPIGITSLVGGTTQGSVSYAAWLDNGNAAFGKSLSLFSGTGAGAFSGSGLYQGLVADPFSLTLQVDVTHIGRRLSSFDFEIQVPEPGSLALLGFGLLGFGLMRRKAG